MKGVSIVTAIFGSLTYLAFLCVIGLLLKHVLRIPQQQEERQSEEQEAFEEFYLDLHRFDTAADFTQEEAQALYWVYQQRVYAMST